MNLIFVHAFNMGTIKPDKEQASSCTNNINMERRLLNIIYRDRENKHLGKRKDTGQKSEDGSRRGQDRSAEYVITDGHNVSLPGKGNDPEKDWRGDRATK